MFLRIQEEIKDFQTNCAPSHGQMIGVLGYEYFSQNQEKKKQQKRAKLTRSGSSRTAHAHHKKHRKDESRQEGRTHEETSEPLTPTTTDVLLPSVSAITGRKA